MPKQLDAERLARGIPSGAAADMLAAGLGRAGQPAPATTAGAAPQTPTTGSKEATETAPAHPKPKRRRRPRPQQEVPPASTERQRHANPVVRLPQPVADELTDAWYYQAGHGRPRLRLGELAARYITEGLARDKEKLGLAAFPIAGDE